MTTYNGNSGLLKVGGTPTTVAELTGFSMSVTEGTLEDTAQGDSAATHMPDGIQRWSGSMKGHYFPGDASGQGAVVEGASLAFEGYPIGSGTGKQKLSGTIIVTQIDVDSSLGAIVSFSANFTGTGALVRATI